MTEEIMFTRKAPLGKVQAEMQVRPKRRWDSDEPIVAMNPVPMNVGNGWQGRIQGTLTDDSERRQRVKKPGVDAKGLSETEKPK